MFCPRSIRVLGVYAGKACVSSCLCLVVFFLWLAVMTACGGYSTTASGSQNQPTAATPTPPPQGPAASNSKSFSNLQASSGWGQAAQGPPSFVNCSPSPCNGISFGMQQGITNPSMSGAAAQFSVGGTAVYGDAFFNNHLIGGLSSQGMPDTAGTLVPTLHTFTYDVYFYGDNLALSQALEFDVNQFFNSTGFIWGNECRIAGGNQWDVWDNVNAKWTPTGVACFPNSNAWNHVTIQVQRTSDNQLLYNSITLNGQTSNLNLKFPPGTAPADWYGVTINYQMDGNYKQDPYSIFLDQLTFSYQ